MCVQFIKLCTVDARLDYDKSAAAAAGSPVDSTDPYICGNFCELNFCSSLMD